GPAARRPPVRPGLLLDRDGTLIVDRPYLADPDAVEILPGVVDALRRLDGWWLGIVTNQPGVARGWLTVEQVEAVNQRVVSLLWDRGVDIAGVWWCPHAPEGERCGCAKPAPGLVLDAVAKLELDPHRSWMVGDKQVDADAGTAAGIHGLVLDDRVPDLAA